jgi:glutamyl-tRNA reductase
VSRGETKRIAVVGANHRSSGAVLRDRLFVTESMAPEVAQLLLKGGVENFLLLSTCDRVEVQMSHVDPFEGAAITLEVLAVSANASLEEIKTSTYCLFDEAAVRHIFSVASSLDSQVIGEPQVLGQLKECYRLAEDAGRLDSLLSRTLQHSFRVAKRVRGETEIATGVVSLASAAVSVARNLHGDLGDKHALLFGLGDMGELVGEQLRAAGLSSFGLMGHSQRTEAEARDRGYQFEPVDKLDGALARADMVVCANGTGRIEVEVPLLRTALQARRRRPILVIDTGIPAEVDAQAEELDDIFLYTLNDLEQVAMQGRSQREEASAQAWTIVDNEVVLWRQREMERDAAPLVTGLRAHFEAVREEILNEAPSLSAEEATRRLLNRLLHGPIEKMRRDLSAISHDREETVSEIEHAIAKLFYEGDTDEGE